VLVRHCTAEVPAAWEEVRVSAVLLLRVVAWWCVAQETMDGSPTIARGPFLARVGMWCLRSYIVGRWAVTLAEMGDGFHGAT